MSEISLTQKYSEPVPRYTSYPTAVHFHAGIDGTTMQKWLASARGESSIYIHMAYCKALCLYCGCNMKVTNNPETITAYVDAVWQEMDMAARWLPEKPDVSTIHLGGGTPSYVPQADLERIIEKVRTIGDVRKQAEISMEIDPRQLPDSLPAFLGSLGFNRASLGIQDTNKEVQQAIRRIQPHELNIRAVELLRKGGDNGYQCRSSLRLAATDAANFA